MVGFKIICLGLFLGKLVTSSSMPENESEVKSYAGYKLLRTAHLQAEHTAQKLISILDSMEGVDFWIYPKVSETSDILVSPDTYSAVKDVLEELDVDHEILQEDISKLIEAEMVTDDSVQASSGHKMDWQYYHNYNEIYGYCKYLNDSTEPSPSGAVVTMETIGVTTEGRPIVVMHVRAAVNTSESVDILPRKKAIWLEGGIHAREWISPATVTYILNTLVMDKNKSEELLQAFDWYIVPVINVDGYEFSRSSTRMWRKTRSLNRNSRCRGTDPNRNFAYRWRGQGSSRNPCDENYAGSTPFSEPETRAIRDAISKRKDDIAMYISFHSYGQLILIPWSGDRRKSADYAELHRVGVKGQQAIFPPYGTRYRVGTGPDLAYVCTGTTDDWVKAVVGIKYVYTFELRGRGPNGFILPRAEIILSGIETFEGVKAMAMAITVVDSPKPKTQRIPL